MTGLWNGQDKEIETAERNKCVIETAQAESASDSDVEQEPKTSSKRTSTSTSAGLTVFLEQIAGMKDVSSSSSIFQFAARSIKDFDPSVEVTVWTSFFRKQTARLSEIDKLSLFHAKVSPGCHGWITETEKDGSERTSTQWLDLLEGKYRRTPIELR